MSAAPTAIVTGASRGLGRALAEQLLATGWRVVVDARGHAELQATERELRRLGDVIALAGDVSDARHRSALVDAAGERIDLLVNNASALGPSPLPELAAYPLDALESVMRVNVLAPLGLIQLALARIDEGVVINVTSDAASEAYPGWGGYGCSKAALERLGAVLAAERPHLRVYTVDPGDMRTRMHQDAFPGQDISDRPPPQDSVPGLLVLIADRPPSGRYLARELQGAVR